MKSFLPNENIEINYDYKIINCLPQRNSVNVRVPSRLHMSVIDMNKFHIGKAGGGGIGVGLQLYTIVEVSLCGNQDKILHERPSIIRRILYLSKIVFSYKGFFKVKIIQKYPKHVGLGSSSAAMATFIAINFLFGNRLSNEQIVELYVKNAVEEDPNNNDRCIECFETGTGPWVNIMGGINVISDKNVLVTQNRLSVQDVLLLVPDKSYVAYSAQWFSKSIYLFYGFFNLFLECFLFCSFRTYRIAYRIF